MARARLPWRDMELAAIADGLQGRYGIVFSASRLASAEDAMLRVMHALRIDGTSRLRERARLDATVVAALVRELTIGETYFFRESGQLHYLRETVLPSLVPQVGARPLRCWSAGCATGEEPYSLAMLFRDAPWPVRSQVLGTDLVPERLAAARAGRYGAWSMRGVPAEAIACCFAREGRMYVLDPAIRDVVRFAPLDLLHDAYPGEGQEPLDVIFCRNVLIYFDRAAITHIATRLLASLAPHGWLFLSATDPVLTEYVDCIAVPTGAGLVYRRLDAPGAATGRVTSAGTAGDGTRAAAPRAARGVRPAPPAAAARHAAAAHAQRQVDADADSEPVRMLLVRALANRGDVAAATTASAAAIARFPLSSRLVTLHATLLLQADDLPAAMAAARRAVYLDRRAPLAHLVFGEALARDGRAAPAVRAFTNAADLAAKLPADQLVDDTDDMTAGRVRELAAFRARTAFADG